MAESNNTTAERELLKTIEGNPTLKKKVKAAPLSSFIPQLQARLGGLLGKIKKGVGGQEKKFFRREKPCQRLLPVFSRFLC